MKYGATFLLGACAFASCAQAAMAPKYERLQDFGLALGHMQEIARLLDGPIEKIEYLAPDVLFIAGRCQVAVAIHYGSGLDANGTPVLGGRSATVTIGPKICR